MTDEKQSRTRTVRWQAPEDTSAFDTGMSGYDFLRAIFEERVPRAPIFETIAFYMAEAEPGRIVYALKPEEFHYNVIGNLHGGIPALLLDSAMGSSIHSTLPAGVGHATIELKINFVRPITIATGEVRAEAEVIHVGKRTATASGRLVDSAGKLYAHGSTTLLIFPLTNPPRAAS